MFSLKSFIRKYKSIVLFLFAGIIMVLAFPLRGMFHYSYKLGNTWMYETLIAPFDFPVLKTQEQLMSEMEEKSSQIIDYYQFEEEISNGKLADLRLLLSKEEFNDSRDFISTIEIVLMDIYNKGVISHSDELIGDEVVYVQRDKRAKEIPLAEIFTVESAYYDIRSEASQQFGEQYSDSLLNAIRIKDYISSNLKYDESTTQALHRNAVESISPTSGIVFAGQLIVSQGELITKEVLQLLDSYKAEYFSNYGYSESSLSSLVSHILFVFFILSFLSSAIFVTDKSIFKFTNKLLYVLTLTLLTFFAICYASRQSDQLRMLLPLSMYVIFAMACFKPSTVYATYLVALLPILLMIDNGVEFFFSNAIVGMVIIRIYNRFSRGWRQFLLTILVFVTLLIVYFSFILINGRQIYWVEIGTMMGHSILIIIAFPFVFLMERIFKFVSQARLWELTDTGNPMLQDLSRKAPGTFQHSLQVASLAEEACRVVGGNVMLVKVGALYHDIGKTLNPQCFVENQTTNVNYHASLSSENSAADIIRHVDDGLYLVKKRNLPNVIGAFIASHHGTTLTSFFYSKYVNEGGNPDNKGPFRYHGNLPVSKEEVLLMFADSIEAASRSLSDYSTENISKLVDRIIDLKISEGQIVSADVSLKEIAQVRECFKEFLSQMYHTRVAYPTLD